ncbi:GreA/GreB family elongation factor [Marinomonas mediterranea]|jgi:Transcription elongation factor, GreA/GreB, C-term.|uniref:Transcription elongation factor GreA/GreB domain-containing protein n=1 Tax=Marinomonas mediterranea (strain ATCC 700492 / JCM 21426 / NBRC 103028 / MMB-1) TaxID=717774 RepID=F2K2T2_MARM1|nr:GreA/GreB family elongation factor [Marinomonas mediterranea]ADZ91215.1 transcription elongation factor GreA/GreB domain-containing protein [Marinomonas mediterranea MMB-1]WCN17341.1 transcription elongation factor [Marinomonas mediterranea MMB-1]
MLGLKERLLELLPTFFQERLDRAVSAANQARAAATDAESVAETKYDTFGLENSYLAHGQTQRVFECREDLHFFMNWRPNTKDRGAVSVGDLVEVDVNGVTSFYLLVPRCGGNKVSVQAADIQLVSLDSPIGKSLMGKSEGDEFTVLRAGVEVYAEISDIHY